MKITTPNGTLEGENIEAILKEHGLDCLRSADLHGADLRCANLSDADLSAADLHGANLRSADLRCANLRCADLSDADLSDASVCIFAKRVCGACDANIRLRRIVFMALAKS